MDAKKLSPVILAIAILAVAGTGSYFYFSSEKEQEKILSDQDAITAAKSTIAIPPKIEPTPYDVFSLRNIAGDVLSITDNTISMQSMMLEKEGSTNLITGPIYSIKVSPTTKITNALEAAQKKTAPYEANSGQEDIKKGAYIVVFSKNIDEKLLTAEAEQILITKRKK